MRVLWSRNLRTRQYNNHNCPSSLELLHRPSSHPHLRHNTRLLNITYAKPLGTSLHRHLDPVPSRLKHEKFDTERRVPCPNQPWSHIQARALRLHRSRSMLRARMAKRKLKRALRTPHLLNQSLKTKPNEQSRSRTLHLPLETRSVDALLPLLPPHQAPVLESLAPLATAAKTFTGSTAALKRTGILSLDNVFRLGHREARSPPLRRPGTMVRPGNL